MLLIFETLVSYNIGNMKAVVGDLFLLVNNKLIYEIWFLIKIIIWLW